MPFVSASFTAPDGTLVSNYIPETGGGFTSPLGSHAITGGQARHGAAAGVDAVSLANALPATADYDVEADYISINSPNSQPALVARSNPAATTYYRIRYQYGNKFWYLERIVAGVTTGMGGFGAAIGQGNNTRVKFEIRDATKTVFVDGTQMVQSSNNTITDAGQAGFRTSDGGATNGQQFDNFVATDVGVAGPTPVSIAPARIESTAQVRTPSVAAGTPPATVAPARIESTAAVRAPAVVASVPVVAPARIDSESYVFAPAVVEGTPAGIVALARIESTATVPVPTLAEGVPAGTIAPQRIESTASVGALAVVVTPQTLTIGRIDSTAAVHAPELVAGVPEPMVVLLPTIPSGASVFALELVLSNPPAKLVLEVVSIPLQIRTRLSLPVQLTTRATLPLEV